MQARVNALARLVVCRGCSVRVDDEKLVFEHRFTLRNARVVDITDVVRAYAYAFGVRVILPHVYEGVRYVLYATKMQSSGVALLLINKKFYSSDKMVKEAQKRVNVYIEEGSVEARIGKVFATTVTRKGIYPVLLLEPSFESKLLTVEVVKSDVKVTLSPSVLEDLMSTGIRVRLVAFKPLRRGHVATIAGFLYAQSITS